MLNVYDEIHELLKNNLLTEIQRLSNIKLPT